VYLLSLLGVLLVAGIMLLPVTPSVDGAQNDLGVTAGDAPSEGPSVADRQVDEALQALQDGSLPPMEAITQIRDIAEQYPENFKANLTLGALSLRTGQFENAVMRLRKVIAVNPDVPQAYELLGQAHLYLQDTAAARTQLQKALELLPPSEQEAVQNKLNEISN